MKHKEEWKTITLQQLLQVELFMPGGHFPFSFVLFTEVLDAVAAGSLHKSSSVLVE